jgi:hypothetical protein
LVRALKQKGVKPTGIKQGLCDFVLSPNSLYNISTLRAEKNIYIYKFADFHKERVLEIKSISGRVTSFAVCEV